jgi:triphosphatase
VHVEQEYKYRLSPENLLLIKALPQLQSVPMLQFLSSTYFDTPDNWLLRQGYGLRILEKEGHYYQTLKGGGMIDGAFHQRHEWHAQISSAMIEPAYIPLPDIQEKLEQFIAQNTLQKRFMTVFERQSWLFDYEDAEIECCIDQGQVIAGHRTAPIFELELELISGALTGLHAFITSLLSDIDLVSESDSKAHRGYRLLGGYTHSV